MIHVQTTKLKLNSFRMEEMELLSKIFTRSSSTNNKTSKLTTPSSEYARHSFLVLVVRNFTRYLHKTNERKVYVPTLSNDNEIIIKYKYNIVDSF